MFRSQRIRILGFVLLPLVAVAVAEELNQTNKSQVKRQTAVGSCSANENIIFSSPELIATVTNGDGMEIYLEAFKIKENDQILLEIPSKPNKVSSLRFMSIGHPQIVHPTASRHIIEGTALVSNPLGFHFYVQMLPLAYREALASAANAKYHTSVRISQNQIVMLTPNSFTCAVAFASPIGLTTVRGKVMTFRTDPLKVNFNLTRNSSVYKKLRNGTLKWNEAVIHCDIFKRAQHGQTDQLVITSQQIDQLDMKNKLFGAANSVFFSRHQMNQLSREIMQNLNIFESFESDDGFESNFVTDLQQHFGIQNAFAPRPIAEVLSSLSPYNVGSDHLRPDDIIRDLSDVLKVETVGDKQHIVTNRESNQLQRERSNGSCGINAYAGFGPFAAILTANYATSMSDEWANDGKSIDDLLNEINRNSQSAVKYERVGLQIVPKSLDVAKISRSAMSQSIKFGRIRRKLNSAHFHREFELSLADTSAGLLTTATAATTTAAIATSAATNTDRCFGSDRCRSWDTADFKMILSCSSDKWCGCISPGDSSCVGNWRCCDGSICSGKCPPAAKCGYCNTGYTSNCQSGLTCTVDDVSLAILPGRTVHGRCLPDLTTGLSTTDATTLGPATTLTSADSKDCSSAWSIGRCQISSDCCGWNTAEYKYIESCGDNKVCHCITPGLPCYGGFRCCDGSVCKTKCPPAAKFHYCETDLWVKCQPGLTCTVDSVSLRIWPGRSQYFGRCL